MMICAFIASHIKVKLMYVANDTSTYGAFMQNQSQSLIGTTLHNLI